MLEKTIQFMDAHQQPGPLSEKGTPPEGTDEIRLGKIFTRLKEMEVLKEEVERKNYLLQSLYELTGELNALEQGEAIYRALLYFSMGVFGVSKGSILLYDPEKKTLTTHLEKGLGTAVSFPCDDLTLTLISGINFPIIPGKKEHEIIFFKRF